MHRINKLAELFVKFPGIGPRQASRFVFFLLRQDKEFVETLSRLIQEIRNTVVQCESCYRFFDADGYANVCDICGSLNRDTSLLMIVEKDADLEAIEKTGMYNGKYFVIGGTVPLLQESNTPLRTTELLKHIEKDAPHIKEVILATSANPEGDNTALYVRSILQPLLAGGTMSVSLLGRGLSTGTELEYSDSDTIRNALQNRR